MEPVSTIRGSAMPLNRADVDTDQIIPAKYLKRVERTGFGRFLFDSLAQGRVTSSSTTRATPRRRCWSAGRTSAAAPRASTRPGRSRTTASRRSSRRRSPTSSATTAPRSACCWCSCRQDEVDILMQRGGAEARQSSIVVDLERQTVGVAGEDWKMHFDIDPFVKHCLLNGLDDIGLTHAARRRHLFV